MSSELPQPPLLSARVLFWSGIALIALWFVIQLLSAFVTFLLTARPIFGGVYTGLPVFDTIAELSLVLGAVLTGAGLVVRRIDAGAEARG